MRKNKFWGYIYIFGSSRAVFIETEHTKEEIEADWELREKLVREALQKECDRSYVQNELDEINYK
jgi:hypothetical protein